MRKNLGKDIRNDRRGDLTAEVLALGRFIHKNKYCYLRVFRGCERNAGGYVIVLTFGIALFGGAGFGDNVITRNAGVFCGIRKYAADRFGGLRRNDLAVGSIFERLYDIAVIIHKRFHGVRHNEPAAVGNSRKRAYMLQRRDLEGLPERRGSQ